MKTLSRWWKQWGLVDAVGLTGGAGLSAAYVAWSARSRVSETVLDLWPNIATEILGVWLSVRIIGAFLSAREERRNVRENLAGNLNYMLVICQRLPHDFFSFSLADLQSEIGFYREKAVLNPRSWKRHLSKEERSVIDKAFQDGERILEQGRLARQALDMISDLARQWDAFELQAPGADIEARLHQYLRSYELDESSVQDSVASVRDQLEHPPAGFRNVAAALQHCDQVQAYMRAEAACSKAIRTLEEDVRQFRGSVWSELAA